MWRARERIDASRWLVPRAEGKWTPAQETRHLILTYDAFLRDARGTGRMQLRGTWLRRQLWRLIGLTSILYRRRIPVAVRAPREARPEWEGQPATELLPLLASRTGEFTTVVSELWSSEPDRCVTHPFFGEINLEHTLRLATVHNRHHAAFLPAPDARTE